MELDEAPEGLDGVGVGVQGVGADGRVFELSGVGLE